MDQVLTLYNLFFLQRENNKALVDDLRKRLLSRGKTFYSKVVFNFFQKDPKKLLLIRKCSSSITVI